VGDVDGRLAGACRSKPRLANSSVPSAQSPLPVDDWLMANHTEPREHDVGQDQDKENLRPIPPAARSASTIAAPAAPAAPVTAVSAMSASAAVHHDEIARVPGRRRARGTHEFAENGHGGMQTARARAL
jgi:hypothetical protein